MRRTEYDFEAAARRLRATAHPDREEFINQYVLNPPSGDQMQGDVRKDGVADLSVCDNQLRNAARESNPAKASAPISKCARIEPAAPTFLVEPFRGD